jgi:hypothetical protein
MCVVSEKAKCILRRFADWTVDGVFWLSILAVVYVFVQVFLFVSFMGLRAGDQVVCKSVLAPGCLACATLRGEQIPIPSTGIARHPAERRARV